MITSAIAILLVLGALIFFHELGHFLVARVFGMGVQAFSLGFGPRLTGFRSGKTDYRLSAIPLGGYVQLVGEAAGEPLPEGFEDKESFSQRPPWQRILVVAAGPVFNFVLAWAIYTGLLWFHGQQELLSVVGAVQAETPAQAAGVQAGDRILSVNGQPIRYWFDLAEAIRVSQGKPMALTLERESGQVELLVTPKLLKRKTIFGEEVMAPMIGVVASGETESIPLGPRSAFLAGLDQTWAVISLTFEGLVKMVERVIPLDNIGGPIMIAQMVHKQSEAGFSNVLALTALISINLGLLNLLPIPVLDGGHILFCTIEMVIRRPVTVRIQQIAVRLGVAFLLGLMALAVYNDIARLLIPS